MKESQTNAHNAMQLMLFRFDDAKDQRNIFRALLSVAKGQMNTEYTFYCESYTAFAFGYIPKQPQLFFVKFKS